MIEWLTALARSDDAGRMSVVMMAVTVICVLGLLVLTVSQAMGVGDPDVIMRGVAGGVMAGTVVGAFFWLRWVMSGR